MPNKFDVHRRREAGEEPGFIGHNESHEDYAEREEAPEPQPAAWPNHAPAEPFPPFPPHAL